MEKVVLQTRLYEEKDWNSILRLYKESLRNKYHFERESEFIRSFFKHPGVSEDGVWVGEKNNDICLFMVLMIKDNHDIKEGHILEIALRNDVKFKEALSLAEKYFEKKEVDLIVSPDFSSKLEKGWLKLTEHVCMSYPLEIKIFLLQTLRDKGSKTLWNNKDVIIETDNERFQIFCENGIFKLKEPNSNKKKIVIKTTRDVLWGIMLGNIPVWQAIFRRQLKVSLSKTIICVKLMKDLVMPFGFYLNLSDHF